MSQHGTTKRLVDSARSHFAKFRRVPTDDIISTMNGPRLDQLVEELPDTIIAMQNLLEAAKRRQTTLRTRK